MSKTYSLFFVLILAHAALAQDSAPTRIAIVNLGEVFHSYEKAKNHKKDLETFLAPYKTASDKLREDLNKQQQIASGQTADMDAKTAASQKALVIRRKLEDLDMEVRKVLGKKQEQSLMDMFAEMRAAVEKHAEANHFDLVLMYGDVLKKEDLGTFANVNRKLQAADTGGAVPIFIRPRIDITRAVITSLNDSYAAKK